MPTLRDIRNRIKGVQNTQQITKAMKMVAAAKLRRAQENIINARPFANKISDMILHLSTEEDRMENIFFKKREVSKILVVVVTADRGLCGAFNTNILREAQRYIKEDIIAKNLDYTLYCIGKKGFDFFRKRTDKILGNNIGIFSTLNYDAVLKSGPEIIDTFTSNNCQKVVFIYNEFKSIVSQKVVSSQYLPIPFDSMQGVDLGSSFYIYEPDQKYIFDKLMPKYLRTQVWRALLESNAAELGARMTAMDNATSNAKELIRSLKMTYNKARQASITKEILEIVSGANALKAS